MVYKFLHDVEAVYSGPACEWEPYKVSGASWWRKTSQSLHAHRVLAEFMRVQQVLLVLGEKVQVQ